MSLKDYYITKSQVVGWWWMNKKILNHCTTTSSSSSPPSSSSIINNTALSVNDLVTNLKTQFTILRAQFFSSDGLRINYQEMIQSPNYTILQQLTTHLTTMSLTTFYRDYPSSLNQIALFVNLYNLLTMHSLCELAASSSSDMTSKFQQFGSSLWTRLTFYAENAYLIDHAAYCLNDIENGILRGNKLSPVPMTRKHIDDSEGSKDPRLPFVIQRPDPRIHFALNCGAVSCPPILVYHITDADEFNLQLEMATSLYLMDHVSLREKDESYVISISPLFQWYREDFLHDIARIKSTNQSLVTIPNDESVCDSWIIEWISNHLNSDDESQMNLKLKLNNALSDISAGKRLKIEYEDYSWNINHV